MATSDRKHTVPAATDTPSRASLLAAFASINDVVPVADATERSTAATAIAPTASRPLFVWRADATTGEELEVTEDGTTWRTITSGRPVGALLHGTGTQAVGTAAWSVVNLDVQQRASGMTTTVASGRINAAVPGVYLVSGMVAFAGSTSGRRGAQIYRNGVSIPQTQGVSPAPTDTTVWYVPTAAYPVSLSAGDYVQLAGIQVSGATINFQKDQSFLQASYMGPL